MSIKAYKAFNEDLTCRDFQYEIGKTYTIDEKPVPCERGFHACLDLKDVFGYYNPTNKIRICEVELNGDIIHHEDKIVTNSITILNEIDYKSMFDIYSPNDSEQMMAAWYMDVEDLLKYLDHHNTSVRGIIAKRGLDEHLDVLVKDKDSSYVRALVAKRGRDKDLDILINDPHNTVLVAVAEQGRPQDLDILVHNPNSYVRLTVAKHGRDKDLDILVKDYVEDVRAIVAEQGRNKDLDVLVKDESWYVRRVVAEQGRPQDLDILAHDIDTDVREVVAREAVAKIGHLKDLEILLNDVNYDIQSIVRLGLKNIDSK